MDLSGFLLAWRTTALPAGQVIAAFVHRAQAAPSPARPAVVRDWPGIHYWSDEPHGRHLVLTRPLGRRRDAWALHLLLLAATLFTTTFVGAVLRGAIPFDPNPLALLLGTYPFPRDFIHAWATGLSFSAPLLAILLCHELGHFVTARRYQLDVSPPFFIPAPVVPWSIGTMGAFIRLPTVVSARRRLLAVGVAVPIAGLLVALPVLVIGFAPSHPAGGPASLHGMVLGLDDGQAVLGDSLLTFALRHLVRGSAPALVLHPIAFAGWLGVFVTMLNLLPISQLDGGHILYSAVPRWHRRTALGFWALIVALGGYWRGGLLWGGLVLLLPRGRLGHPPVLDVHRPLPRSRRLLAWTALILFLITFTPIPFRL